VAVCADAKTGGVVAKDGRHAVELRANRHVRGGLTPTTAPSEGYRLPAGKDESYLISVTVAGKNYAARGWVVRLRVHAEWDGSSRPLDSFITVEDPVPMQAALTSDADPSSFCRSSRAAVTATRRGHGA
jgi:hypothetical protein